MRQIRITRRRHRPGSWRQEPPPHDLRDPDIVHAHEAARRQARSPAGRVRPAGHARTTPVPGGR